LYPRNSITIDRECLAQAGVLIAG
jgi:hypothetical protein